MARPQAQSLTMCYACVTPAGAVAHEPLGGVQPQQRHSTRAHPLCQRSGHRRGGYHQLQVRKQGTSEKRRRSRSRVTHCDILLLSPQGAAAGPADVTNCVARSRVTDCVPLLSSTQGAAAGPADVGPEADQPDGAGRALPLKQRVCGVEPGEGGHRRRPLPRRPGYRQGVRGVRGGRLARVDGPRRTGGPRLQGAGTSRVSIGLRARRIATAHVESQPLTSNRNRSRRIATARVESQPLTSNRNRSRRIATAR
eukprot:1182518-Prorocentrum_minimum.AAC.1